MSFKVDFEKAYNSMNVGLLRRCYAEDEIHNPQEKMDQGVSWYSDDFDVGEWKFYKGIRAGSRAKWPKQGL